MNLKPFQLFDKCVNEKITIILISEKQITGTLKGFNEYFNLILENVTEKYYKNNNAVEEKHKSMLLNGHDIAYIVPGVDRVADWKK